MADWIRLPQGFYGVDVFIVIMGYLLIKGFVNRPEITFSQFASRKLTRLYVPLAAAIILTSGLSLFCMDADLLVDMAKTGTSAMLGAANVQLKISTEGYFAGDASMNPFLHLWYLGVATQLFILAYLTLCIIRKWKKKAIILILSIIGGFSLCCTILNPLRSLIEIAGFTCPWEYNIFSYYDTIPRIWELLAGGAVLFLPEIKNKKAASGIVLTSLAMILIPSCMKSCSSLVVFSVVIGTVLFIRYAHNSSITYLFSNKAAQWLGAISFSLYLIHVPLIVCYKGFFFRDFSSTSAACFLLACLPFAYAFFYILENRQHTLRAVLILWGCALSICLTFWYTDGLKHAWNIESNQISMLTYPLPEQCKAPNITDNLDSRILELHSRWYTSTDWHTRTHSTQGTPEHPVFQLGSTNKIPSFVLLGDSHAEHYVPGINIFCKNNCLSGVFLASIIEPFWDRECPRFDTDYFYNREKAFALFHWLKHHPELKTVIIGQLWSKLKLRRLNWDSKPTPGTVESNILALREFCSRLIDINKKVVIIAPLPSLGASHVLPCARWMKRRNIPEHQTPDEFTCTFEQYQKKYSQINAELDKMEKDGLCVVLKPHLLLFKNGKCLGVKNNKLVFWDEHHISATTSIETADIILRPLIPLLDSK